MLRSERATARGLDCVAATPQASMADLQRRRRGRLSALLGACAWACAWACASPGGAGAWAWPGWVLLTPGGGPLDARCPCLPAPLCPRPFGRSVADALLLGRLPPCPAPPDAADGVVRCCGASRRLIVEQSDPIYAPGASASAPLPDEKLHLVPLLAYVSDAPVPTTLSPSPDEPSTTVPLSVAKTEDARRLVGESPPSKEKALLSEDAPRVTENPSSPLEDASTSIENIQVTTEGATEAAPSSNTDAQRSIEDTTHPANDLSSSTEDARPPTEDIIAQQEGRVIPSIEPHEKPLATVITTSTLQPAASSDESELPSSTETSEAHSTTPQAKEMSTSRQILPGPESSTADAGDLLPASNVEQPSGRSALSNIATETPPLTPDISTEPPASTVSSTIKTLSITAPSLETTEVPLGLEVTTLNDGVTETTTQTADDLLKEENITTNQPESLGVTKRPMPDEYSTMAIITTTDEEGAGTTLLNPSDISSDETTPNAVDNPSIYETSTDAITTTISSDIVDVTTNPYIPSETSTVISDGSQPYFSTTIPNNSSPTFEEEYPNVSTTQREEIEYTTTADSESLRGEEKLPIHSSDETQNSTVTIQRTTENTTTPIMTLSFTENSVLLNGEPNEMNSNNTSPENQEDNGNTSGNDDLVKTAEYFTNNKESTKVDIEQSSMIETADINANLRIAEKQLVTKFNYSSQFENEGNKTDEELMIEALDMLNMLKKESHSTDENTNVTSQNSTNESLSIVIKPLPGVGDSNVTTESVEMKSIISNLTTDYKEATNISLPSLKARRIDSDLKPEINSPRIPLPSLETTKEQEEIFISTQNASLINTSPSVGISSSKISVVSEIHDNVEEMLQKSTNETNIPTESAETTEKSPDVALTQETKTENNSVSVTNHHPQFELLNPGSDNKVKNFKDNKSEVVVQEKKPRRLHPFVLIEDDLGELNVTNDVGHLDNSVGPLGQFVQLVSKPLPSSSPAKDTSTEKSTATKTPPPKSTKQKTKFTTKSKRPVDCLPSVLRVARRPTSPPPSSTTPKPSGDDGIVVVLPSDMRHADADVSDVLLVYPCAAPQRSGAATTEKTMVVLANSVYSQELQGAMLPTEASPIQVYSSEEKQMSPKVETAALSVTLHDPSIRTPAEETIEDVKILPVNAELPEMKVQTVLSMAEEIPTLKTPAEDTKILPVEADMSETTEVQDVISMTTEILSVQAPAEDVKMMPVDAELPAFLSMSMEIPSLQTPAEVTNKDAKMLSENAELAEAKESQDVLSTTTESASLQTSTEKTIEDATIIPENAELHQSKEVQTILSITTQVPSVQMLGEEAIKNIKMPVNAEVPQVTEQLIDSMATDVPYVQTAAKEITEDAKIMSVHTELPEAKVKTDFSTTIKIPSLQTSAEETIEDSKMLPANVELHLGKEVQPVLSTTTHVSSVPGVESTQDVKNMSVNDELRRVKGDQFDASISTDVPYIQTSSKETIEDEKLMPVNTEISVAEDAQDNATNQQLNVILPRTEVSSVQTSGTETQKDVQVQALNTEVDNVVISSTKEDTSVLNSSTNTIKAGKTVPTKAEALEMNKGQGKPINEQMKKNYISSTTEVPSEQSSNTETMKDVMTSKTTAASMQEEKIESSVQADTNQERHENDDPFEELTILSPSEKVHHIFTLESEPGTTRDIAPENEKNATSDSKHLTTTTHKPIFSTHRPFGTRKPTSKPKVVISKNIFERAPSTGHRGVFRPSRPHFPIRNRASTDSSTRASTSPTTTKRNTETTSTAGIAATAGNPILQADATTATNSHTTASPSTTSKPAVSTEISTDAKPHTHFASVRFTSATANSPGLISTLGPTSTESSTASGQFSTTRSTTREDSQSRVTSSATEASSTAGSARGEANPALSPAPRPLRPRDRLTLFPRRTRPELLHTRRDNDSTADAPEAAASAPTAATTTQRAPQQAARYAPRPFRPFAHRPAPASAPAAPNGTTTESTAEATTSSPASSAQPSGAMPPASDHRPRHRFRPPPAQLRAALRLRTRPPHAQHAQHTPPAQDASLAETASTVAPQSSATTGATSQPRPSPPPPPSTPTSPRALTATSTPPPAPSTTPLTTPSHSPANQRAPSAPPQTTLPPRMPAPETSPLRPGVVAGAGNADSRGVAREGFSQAAVPLRPGVKSGLAVADGEAAVTFRPRLTDNVAPRATNAPPRGATQGSFSLLPAPLHLGGQGGTESGSADGEVAVPFRQGLAETVAGSPVDPKPHGVAQGAFFQPPEPLQGASMSVAGRESTAVPSSLAPLRPSVAGGVASGGVPGRESVSVAGGLAQPAPSPPAPLPKPVFVWGRWPLPQLQSSRHQQEQALTHHLLQVAPGSLREDAGHQATKRNSPRAEVTPTTAPSAPTPTAAPARPGGLWDMLTAMVPFGARLRAKMPFRPTTPAPAAPNATPPTAPLSTNSLELAPVTSEEQRRPLSPRHPLQPSNQATPSQPLRQLAFQSLAERHPPLNQHETQQLASNFLHQTSAPGHFDLHEQLHEEIVHQRNPLDDQHLTGPKKTLQQVLHLHQAVSQSQQKQPDQMFYYLVHQDQRNSAHLSPEQPPRHEASYNVQLHPPQALLMQPPPQTHEAVAAPTPHPYPLNWVKIDQPSFGPLGVSLRPVRRTKRA